MNTVDTFVHAPEPKSATVSPPAHLPLTLGDLERFLSTAKAGDTIEYFRGFLCLDRGAGSRLGDDAGEELDHIATALMAMAEARRLHLVQRRHGAFDYTYFAVMARGARTRRLA
jgi:hypothetical protein